MKETTRRDERHPQPSRGVSSKEQLELPNRLHGIVENMPSHHYNGKASGSLSNANGGSMKIEKRNIVLELGESDCFYRLYLWHENKNEILLTRMDLIELKEAIEEVLQE